MAKARRMAELGRRGGRAGGPARARALAPARRKASARTAARARWSKPALAGEGPLDLPAVVAHCGSRAAARLPPPARLEALVVRAVKASRADSSLARMLPVFLWRLRDRLDLGDLVRAAGQGPEAPALGFFLEAASRLGGSAIFEDAIARLRRRARPARPLYFFRGTERRAFECAAALRATPPEARRWGLLMNMPWESFEAYFAKAAPL
ncbi:MAG TPA: hypothetical protein VMR21_16590 [Vicinamibacteria bacterium]|nr:hypothetical protein [Vicinamibacteria bacterium]